MIREATPNDVNDKVGIGVYHDSINNIIIGNEITEQAIGIWLWADANNNEVRGNEIYSNLRAFFGHESSGNIIRDNLAYDNLFSFGFGGEFTDNQIYNNFFNNTIDIYYLNEGNS